MIWHGASLNEVISYLETDPERGLSNGVAEQRKELYGSNSLSFSKGRSYLSCFLSQFKNFSVIALMVVAVISLLVTIIGNGAAWYVPIIIVLIVALNNSICAYQEIKAEDMADVLKDVSAPVARVFRDGITKNIDSSQLVPGDIIVLKEGDYISADARIISAFALSCNEAPLTGVDVPVDKNADFAADDITPLAERQNMVFAGCSVIHGKCVAVVAETGKLTEIGKEHSMIEQTQSNRFPIKESVLAFSKTFSTAALVVALLVFILGLIFDNSNTISATLIDSFTTAMALAVAVIPEGIPLAVAIILTLGTQRLVNKKVVVKDMSSIEKMGGISVICADKTGTLTENIMTVKKVFNGKDVCELCGDCGEDVRMILELATICNNASETSGDPTGMGIADACRAVTGMSKQDIENLYPRLGEVPFDSERMLMTTINMINGKPFAIVKGAPEALLPLCIGNVSEKFGEVIESLAKDALRVIAVAAKPIAEIPANPNSAELECNLNFIGLLGLEDQPRADAVSAVEECRKAGIKTVMITGDHPATAKAIARRLGILTDDTELLTNTELSKMSDEELNENIERYSVFARLTNAERIRIVKAWQEKGHTVAVTGDSVDDTPALMTADVGCAMGKSGTDVAKGVSDIILLDDDFSSIVYSVKEGRAIFANIRKMLNYLISSNVGELLFVLIGSLIFGRLPLTAILLLLVNLITDIFPVISIGMEPPESDVMKSLPQRKQTVFNKPLFVNVSMQALLVAILSIVAFAVGKNAATSITLAFAVLTLSQVFFALSARTESIPVALCFGKNYTPLLISFLSAFVLFVFIQSPINKILGLTALGATSWLIIILLSAVPFLVAETYKMIKYFKKKTA